MSTSGQTLPIGGMTAIGAGKIAGLGNASVALAVEQVARDLEAPGLSPYARRRLPVARHRPARGLKPQRCASEHSVAPDTSQACV